MATLKTITIYDNYELLEMMNDKGIEAVIMNPSFETSQIEDFRLRILADQLRSSVRAIDEFMTEIEQDIR